MNEFEELIQNRRDFAEINKKNKFNLNSLLAGLYNDPSHFIYEILQNAEDAEAKEVRFELFEDRLDIYHNGIDFDFQDVEGVTGIGISRKKDDLNAIGKFGVGFKSVFAITQTPFIYSGKYNLKIEDFVVPSIIKREGQISGTKIVLPFNHELRHSEEIFNLVSKKLEAIGLKTLLFLKNIEEIKWQTPSNEGHYLKSKNHVEEFKNVRKVTIISNLLSEEYLVIERPLVIEGKNLKVEIAYRIGKNKEGKEIIVSEIESKLVVFFPTERPTYLNFLIQGPYKTTPNRENIPIDDEQNKTIVEETGNLLAESLPIIKKLGFLDKDFLGLLPINPENNKKDQIHSILFEKVKERLKGEEGLLPTIDGRYTKSSDALLARGKELTTLLGKDDLKELFSKADWLNTDITPDQAKELRDYLINELGVIEIDFENFAGKITTNFLTSKSDEWMIKFYSSLLDQRALWREKISYWQKAGILRTKPIIRLENNEHISPFDDNGKIQVYLPSESKSEYKTVKSFLAEDEDSLSFLKELGLTTPDIFSEIREFILPKYRKDNVNIETTNYLEDLGKVLNAYNIIGQNTKEEFLSQFIDVNFVLSINPLLDRDAFKKPSEVYLNDTKLKDYFANNDAIYFVSKEVENKFDNIKALICFLQDIGVESKPKKRLIDSDLSETEKESLRKNSDLPRKSWEHVYDYDIEGMDKFINNPTKIQSLALWVILSEAPISYFEGEYKWGHVASNPRTKKFSARFLKTLRVKTWLYDKQGNLRSPFDLEISDLDDEYTKNEPSIEILTRRLEFRPKIIDQLPDECKIKLELTKELSPEVLKSIVEEYKNKFAKEPTRKELGEEGVKDWLPEVHPEEIEVKIEVEELEKIDGPDLKGQEGRQPTSNDSGKKQDGREEKEPAKLTANAKKQIGDWGERYVFKALREKFEKDATLEETEFGFRVIYKNNPVEAIWLNKNGNLGKGYDFLIKKNGVEVEYIEVKTKTGEGDELIEITGTQWEFARKLFEQNEGEKYSIYVVVNAGLQTSKIKYFNNPIKLWKDGKLYAHPINFKL